MGRSQVLQSQVLLGALADGEASQMKITICTVGIGHWYPRGVARLCNELGSFAPQCQIKAWVNELPPHTPECIRDGYDYTPYAAKPWALWRALQDSDIALLCDASFYPIRDIAPLLEHINRTGYYLCRNGYDVGQWAADGCLEAMGYDRYGWHDKPDVSSNCVGLTWKNLPFVAQWAARSTRETIAWPHTASHCHQGRNRGFVSNDKRVKGHRHDQTVLSILAHEWGMTQFCSRPQFTAYKGGETWETVMVCEGMKK